MATFPKIREYIELNITQNLNYMHFKRVLNDILDLFAVATNTYSGGNNIEITSEGIINVVADLDTENQFNAGFEDAWSASNKNKK